jgi:hypothetical protein
VVAGAPVLSVIAAHSRSSVSNPSHAADVPFQAITSTLASASSRAASRIGGRSNWRCELFDSEISVTRNRLKCALAPGRSASMAAHSGSSTVFDDGVSMPSLTGLVMVLP